MVVQINEYLLIQYVIWRTGNMGEMGRQILRMGVERGLQQEDIETELFDHWLVHHYSKPEGQ